jgi:hypothetical protein
MRLDDSKRRRRRISWPRPTPALAFGLLKEYLQNGLGAEKKDANLHLLGPAYQPEGLIHHPHPRLDNWGTKVLAGHGASLRGLTLW